MHDDPDGEPEELVDAAHPLGVAAGQVVVHRNQVHTLAGQRVQVDGQGGDQRLAFAGLHLSDGAAVQDHAADELHVEVAHVDHAAAGLPADGKRLGQDAIQRLAVGDALPESDGLAAQVVVAEAEQPAFKLADARDDGAHAFEDARVLGAKNLFCDVTEQGNPSAPRQSAEAANLRWPAFGCKSGSCDSEDAVGGERRGGGRLSAAALESKRQTFACLREINFGEDSS